MSMLAPVKIDGFGVRRNASDTEVANSENRVKFVRMYAQTAVTKGDTVALSFTDTEPTSGGGYGNEVVKANTGTTTDSCEMRLGCGVAAEAIAAGAIGKIQVAGICDFARVTTGTAAPGEPLMVDSFDGCLIVKSSSETNVVAIHVKDGTNRAADSSIFLINPANL